MLATAELRKRNQRHTRQFAVTARRLADFLASLEAEEALLEQRLRDAEARDVLAIIESDRGCEQGGALWVAESPPSEGGSDARKLECQLDEGIASGDDTLVIYEDY